jgi:hypothetical protein
MVANGYIDTFDEEPKLADDLNAQHRYNAAYAVALAGCGSDQANLLPQPRRIQRASNSARLPVPKWRKIVLTY